MKIGIDISQIVYEGTGVAEYVRKLVERLVVSDIKNEYVLFFSHHRANIVDFESQIAARARAKVTFKKFKYPIQFLEFLWNRLHIAPIEWFIGDVDVFYTSDWVEPPTKSAKKITTIHDLSTLKVTKTFDKKIVDVHKRKLAWVTKEAEAILCDSEATKKDAIELLNVPSEKLYVVYPGI